MELKAYQRAVLDDLAAFASEYAAYGEPSAAYKSYWERKALPSARRYVETVKDAPSVCIKVPTGGGKTFIACNALRVVTEAVPTALGKPVVWFVPSLAILDQTLKTLRDPSHPYRQKLSQLFAGRVEVLDKSEALAGASFDPDTVRRSLVILVVSYDSFRSSTKEGRKVYQENPGLLGFQPRFGKGTPIENADDSSLAQTLNAMRPVIVIDESHNAKSTLSLEMVRNLNPSFVLELTATPRPESNVISTVDAVRLKHEQMVKIPVIVYNTRDVSEVVRTAIDLRLKLERAARSERERSGAYIRPIALFQAEPRRAAAPEDEGATFRRIREKLISVGIPADQIAIKTAEIDELKGVDLLAEACLIRFVLTVNALKEGWDCPFAYVLASLANRSSEVDVEQIVGRILRQPYARLHPNKFLNLSYVLTASDRFYETLQHVVSGLNRCGYSDADFRVLESQLQPTTATASTTDEGHQMDFVDLIAPAGIPAQPSVAKGVPPHTEAEMPAVESSALQQIEHLVDSSSSSATTGSPADATLVSEVTDQTDVKEMRVEFVESARATAIPQFFIREDAGLFNDVEGPEKKLARQDLVRGFRLTNQDTNLDFPPTELELFEVDVRSDAQGVSRPEITRMNQERSREFAQLVSGLSEEDRKRELGAILHAALRKFDEIPEQDIGAYVTRVVGSQSADRLADMMQNPYKYAELLKLKLISLMTAHAVAAFNLRATENSLLVKPSWRFPRAIQVPQPVSGLRNSLYVAESEMNHFELEVAHDIAALDNVIFWHRNIERRGFCLNGFINHYPDFIVVTRRRNVLLVESKGDDRNNEDSAQKLRLAQAWEKKAGQSYKYFMVFQTIHVENAFPRNQFAQIAGRL